MHQPPTSPFLIPLKSVGESNYRTAVEVLFQGHPERREVGVTIVGGEGADGESLYETIPGESDQLLAKANEYMADDLPLKFYTPVWIAFAGLEQVRLEVIPRSSATTLEPTANANRSNLEIDGLPGELPVGKPSAAALKWHFAWQQLRENRKKAEVGAIAPQGPEVLAAERDLAVAEAEFRDQPAGAARAQIDYARSMLEIARRKFGVGKATTSEVNEATLLLAQAEEALAKLPSRLPAQERALPR